MTTLGQEINTLSFYSKAFNEQRTVCIHKPEFYKHKPESVKLPVIHLLDGQHEWFIEPLLSDIRFLQCTHEIPNTTVVVPHADFSAHNAVSIVFTPTFLTQVFENFRGLYSEIAKGNGEYRLVNAPEAIEREVQKIIPASKIDGYFYPPELVEINGIALRYWDSNLDNLAIEITKLGIEYYPNYYEFYPSLYELTLDEDKNISRDHLITAETF